ncbi:molecular chaperone DnaJ [Oscillatoriales cyanobacterium USR001]|nr:molecular chaperone DnaJ [Oscillatoriales cyanobacterium USR001]
MVDVFTNYYHTLNVNPTATQAEIRQAYRRLAKLFHPDSNRETAGHEQIIQINAAYEILGDPEQRQSYDRQISHNFQQESQGEQKRHRKKETGREADEQIELWLTKVYKPVNKMLSNILTPLKKEINELSADPFDDRLLGDFQNYLETSRQFLKKAQGLFRSIPNPPNLAGVAAQFYHCLNHVADGIEELEMFTLNYDDRCLHTGQELFKIAAKLRREAQNELKVKS